MGAQLPSSMLSMPSTQSTQRWVSTPSLVQLSQGLCQVRHQQLQHCLESPDR